VRKIWFVIRKFLHEKATSEARRLPLRRVLAQEALAAFKLWQAKPDKVPY
jgi:hypothetical protein